MGRQLGVKIFALIEVLIGSITFISVAVSLFNGYSTKPLEIVLFVLVTSIVSAGLGIGLLYYNHHTYHMLMYFSSVIILSKILIFAKIISLSGALETSVPDPLKNTISIIYHGLVILYFMRNPVKERFKVR